MNAIPPPPTRCEQCGQYGYQRWAVHEITKPRRFDGAWVAAFLIGLCLFILPAFFVLLLYVSQPRYEVIGVDRYVECSVCLRQVST